MTECTCCGKVIGENLPEPSYCTTCVMLGHDHFFSKIGERLSKENLK